jgi:RNA polymerase sigma factor (sigma-70 family)
MMVILLSSAKMDETDQALINLYRNNNDKEIIGELFNRYSGFVLAVCMKYVQDTELAEEFTVEIFGSLFLKLKKHKVEYFKTWLYTLAKNHCLQYHRKNKYIRKYQQAFSKEQANFVESEENLHLTAMDNEKPQINIESAIQKLNQQQAQCVSLFYLNNKTYIEISRETGYNLNKVKSYIQNGKRNLKMILEGKK